MSYVTYAANFNGNDLTQILGLTVLATNPYVPAKRSLTIADLARSNKSKINSAFYTKKTIAVRCGITRATRDLTETSFDSLMGLIQGREKVLLLRQAGANRKYTATLADIVMRVDGGSYLEFDLIFETSDHYGYDNAETLLLQVSSYTSANKTDQITIGGSAEWQPIKIVYTLTAVNTSGTNYVQFSNDANGQSLKVTRVWTAGDVLEIDSLNQTVKINGTEVNFTGAFLEFALGVGYLSYSSTFVSSRTASYRVTYIKRYV